MTREGFPSFVNFGVVQPSLNPDNEYVIVTGASQNHVLSLVNLLYSTLLANPYSPLVIVDYGIYEAGLMYLLSNITQIHLLRKQIGSESLIYYRKFNFDHFPEWCRITEPLSVGGYSWKIITIFDVITEYKGVVLWTDTGSIVGNIDKDIQCARMNGFYSNSAGHSIRKWTHPGTYQYLEEMKWITVMNSTKDKWCCNDGYMIIDYRNRTVMENIIYPTVKCSLTKKCITPIGSHRRNHRQDQSVISIFVQSLGIHQACDPQHPSSVQFHKDDEKHNYRIDMDGRFLQILKSKYNITVTSVFNSTVIGNDYSSSPNASLNTVSLKSNAGIVVPTISQSSFKQSSTEEVYYDWGDSVSQYSMIS